MAVPVTKGTYPLPQNACAAEIRRARAAGERKPYENGLNVSISMNNCGFLHKYGVGVSPHSEYNHSGAEQLEVEM
ncbi:hypothetical protein J53TS2_10450 [Paenibacillus sp. J53TS2]|nr:hypothetical protein J53TS2_10450 [Paenibacillus sp. J53TS2]